MKSKKIQEKSVIKIVMKFTRVVHLNRELEREIKKYEEKLDWIKNEMEKLTPKKDLNAYYTLQMVFSELTALVAEIQLTQDHISMIETYS